MAGVAVVVVIEGAGCGVEGVGGFGVDGVPNLGGGGAVIVEAAGRVV